jgi:hypothetical protein
MRTLLQPSSHKATKTTTMTMTNLHTQLRQRNRLVTDPPHRPAQHQYRCVVSGSPWVAGLVAEKRPDIFGLPGLQGHVRVFPEGAGPTAREMMATYAPGSSVGFGRPGCAAAVAARCSHPLPSCDGECMSACAGSSWRELLNACARRGAGQPFVPSPRHKYFDRNLDGLRIPYVFVNWCA